jgi:hypothetical protein
MVTSVLKTVLDRAVGHITVVELELVLHLVGHFVCIYMDSDLRDHFTGPNLSLTSRLYLQ